MKTSQAIIVAPLDAITVDVQPEAFEVRDALLAKCGGRSITSPESAERATAIVREIKGFLRSIEDMRREAKTPVLELGYAIDAKANALCNDLKAQAERIAGLIGEWNKRQEELAEQRRREAEAEERRVRAENEAKIRAEEEKRLAEAKRLEAEAAAATDKREKEKLERAAARQLVSLDKATERMDTSTAAAIAEIRNDARMGPSKVKGTATHRVVEYTVTDIEELYAHAPTLCIVTENKAALKAALLALPEGKSLPGVSHTITSQARIRG